MDLFTFLKEKSSAAPPKYGDQGVASSWMPVLSFSLRGTRLRVSDHRMVRNHDNGVTVALPPGLYQVEATAITYGTDRRVAGLRVQQDGSSGERADQIGVVGVDFAAVAVTDAEYPPGKKDLVSIDSGFGDGTFPVWALQTDGVMVGIEIQFIAPGAPYPFGKTHA